MLPTQALAFWFHLVKGSTLHSRSTQSEPPSTALKDPQISSRKHGSLNAQYHPLPNIKSSVFLQLAFTQTSA
ncbi:hypothetical protein DFH09DRAFT_1126587 [Mycena vulgaris]|nr:hypothetical protein DFH09DRAFT_1126587 [Mycena vulgaris]